MRRDLKAVLASTALAALVACGGSGDGTRDDDAGGETTAVTLLGTAATGAPMAGACVLVKDRLGETRNTVADDAGRYQIENLEALALPAMVRAADCTVGGPLPTLYSALDSYPAGANVQLNVTPLTHAALALALSQDLADAFESRSFASKLVDGDKLTAAKQRLQAVLANVLVALGLPADTDVMSTPFEADGTGLDKLLDLVAFDVVYDSTPAIDDWVVRVSDKSAASSVTVTAPDMGPAPAPLAAPSEAVLSLDLAGIAQLINAFNALRETAGGLLSDDLLALIHPDFLQEGYTRDDLIAEFAEQAEEGETGDRMTHYTVLSCDGPEKVCDLFVTEVMADGEVEQFAIKVIFDAEAGRWRFYGNQIPFEFDLKPVIKANVNISAGETVSTTVEAGVNLWLPLDSGYQSARLQVSNDGGSTWMPALDLKAKPDQCPQADHLVIDSGATPNCGNYVAIADEQAQAVNAVVNEGLRRYRIEVFSDTNWTHSVAHHTGITRQHLFTQSTAQTAFEASGLGIEPAGLGTDLVAFTGSGIDNVGAQFITGASAIGNTTWDGRYVAKLDGHITTPAAYALCLGNSTPEQCSSAYGPTAVINHVFLSSRLTGGRGAIWANFNLVAPPLVP